MNDAPLPVGARTIFHWRKWDGARHWQHDCVYLGRDRWGDWFGQPAGWLSDRPGRRFNAAVPNVTLMSPSGDFALTVNQDHPQGTRVYIDLGWDVRWSESSPRHPEGIDMDLDVVRKTDARGTWIDDVDEWEEHREAYGYPGEIIARLEALAAELEGQVRDQVPPFDDATADAWLDILAGLCADLEASKNEDKNS